VYWAVVPSGPAVVAARVSTAASAVALDAWT
jgi:hypothetical protein